MQYVHTLSQETRPKDARLPVYSRALEEVLLEIHFLKTLPLFMDPKLR